MFVPVRPLLPSLISFGKVKNLPYSGTPKRCFTRLSSCLICTNWTRLKRPERESSLLQTFVNYDRKMFYNIELRAQCYKTFITAVTYKCWS